MQFCLKPSPKTIFASGVFEKLPENIRLFGKKPLFILSSTIKSSSKWQNFSNIFENETKINTETISGEPSPIVIDNIVNKWRDKVDVVVACGGGSVIDAGKAIAAILTESHGVKNYLEGVGTLQVKGTTLPFIAIPTTSGTGSEATSNAVISEVGENGFKKSLRHDNYIPKLVILDPILSLSCPTAVTINCGMDAFSQLVEGFLSTNASPLGDAIAITGLKKIMSLEKLYYDGNNINAREDLALASYCSGIVLNNAGLGTVHGFAGTIGGLLAIPHGLICGSLMYTANKLTLEKLRQIESESSEIALNKYAKLGRIIGCKSQDKATQQDYFINELKRLHHLFKLGNLGYWGFTKEMIDTVISLSDNKNNPVNLNILEQVQMLKSII